jgi:putative ubiquitin-RnfH superfamily antitoxin RatB of RatAB toxin-antitoxin module
MVPDEPARLLNVSVAYSPEAGVVDEVKLCLAEGSTVEDALRVSELQARYPQLAMNLAPVGIWGVLCERLSPLRDKDRVEVYRALLVDPKEARRQRHRAQVKKRR